MFAEYILPILLAVTIFLMMIIRNRRQKTPALSQDNLCLWAGDHWVTNATTLMSTINETLNAGIPDVDPTIDLNDWLLAELGRPVRASDVVYVGDLTFLVACYHHQSDNKVYIYSALDKESSRERRLSHA